MASVTHFFLGANGGGGYQSLLSRLAAEPQYDLMLLKGGPGDGRSVFLRTVGEAMEAEGERVEYLSSSLDPDALDGVYLPGMACGAVGGTPCRGWEPQYPAAVDRIVDLGRFYDLTAAKSAREEIAALTDRERTERVRAYRCLSAARQLELDRLASAQRSFQMQRAMRRLDGIINRELKRRGDERGRTAYRFLGGPTGKGTVWRFESVDALCGRVYVFQDRFELAGPLLERLRRAASERGWDTIACVAAEEPGRLEHLLIPGADLAFLSVRPGMEYGAKPARRVRLDAMTAPQERGRERLLGRMTAALREEAESALRSAAETRKCLAAVYEPYTDLDGVRALAAIEAGRLLSWRR